MSDGGENDEKGEPSHTVGGNASRGSHSGKHFVKQLNTQLPYDPAVALLHECPMGRLARGRKPLVQTDVCACGTDGEGRPHAGRSGAPGGPTFLRFVLLRLALVVEAHGALVHAVGLHAILATKAARVVCGDRAEEAW